MHNLAANVGKMLDICKRFSKEFTNEKGNLPRCGEVPKFSDYEHAPSKGYCASIDRYYYMYLYEAIKKAINRNAICL
jgi:hypothetical protein